MNSNFENITTGTKGHGKEIHIIHGNRPYCGSGTQSIVTPRFKSFNRTATRVIAEVTCKKCLAYLAENPDLAAHLKEQRTTKIISDIFKAISYNARKQELGF